MAFVDKINASVQSTTSDHPGFHRQRQLILEDLVAGQEITQHMNIVGSVNPLNESALPPPGSQCTPCQPCRSIYMQQRTSALVLLLTPLALFRSRIHGASMYTTHVLSRQHPHHLC